MKQLYLAICVLSTLLVSAQAIPVEVVNTGSGWTLMRNGEPYYIKGAGGHDHLDQLVALGGNSIRTWSAEDADEILDAAHERGLTVMFGLWVQHERHGFDYNDETAVLNQLNRFKIVVQKYKDHPALLMWGIGNEVDLFYSNTKVWDAIQDIAAMIHEVDPNHPTSTVTAGLDSTEVYLVKTKAPDIDIYGVNTYGDIGKVPGEILQYGWGGPFIISEWGPNGHWEVASTKWGAPLEQTSTEKSASYAERFDKYIAAYRDRCVGSYVFLWGQKQETTSTWYGLFTADGAPTEPLDRLYKAWRGTAPEVAAPSIQSLTLDGQIQDSSLYLKSRDSYTAELQFQYSRDADVDWVVYSESAAQSAGGDFEEALPPVLGVLSRRRDNSVKLTAPEEEGAYRLFVFVRGEDGRTAYANFPFYVLPRTSDDPQPNFIQMKERTLTIPE